MPRIRERLAIFLVKFTCSSGTCSVTGQCVIKASEQRAKSWPEVNYSKSALFRHRGSSRWPTVHQHIIHWIHRIKIDTVIILETTCILPRNLLPTKKFNWTEGTFPDLTCDKDGSTPACRGSFGAKPASCHFHVFPRLPPEMRDRDVKRVCLHNKVRN